MHRASSSPPNPPRPGTPKAHWPRARSTSPGESQTGWRGRGLAVPPARFEILHAPPEHAGLGVGTQLSLAVTRVLTAMAGVETISIADLADLSERGLRSGIGLHGFVHGGLIVDGGRRPIGRDSPPARPPGLPTGLGNPRRHPRTIPGPPWPRGDPGIRPAPSHAQVIDRPALPPGPARALAGGHRTRPDLIRQGRLRASRTRRQPFLAGPGRSLCPTRRRVRRPLPGGRGARRRRAKFLGPHDLRLHR